MPAIETASATIGTVSACDALGVSRATVYRNRQPAKPVVARPASPRALPPGERQVVLDLLHTERFVDQAPAQVHAALLDDGVYLCSPRTMYVMRDFQKAHTRCLKVIASFRGPCPVGGPKPMQMAL
jgi:hypothetical protein